MTKQTENNCYLRPDIRESLQNNVYYTIDCFIPIDFLTNLTIPILKLNKY